MAFDDEEDVPTGPRPTAAQATDEEPAPEDVLEEEAQDYRNFTAMSNKKGFSSQTIRRGEKDFEKHGTKAQESALEQSRSAMEEVLSYTRVHKPNQWCRAWYVPDAWAEYPEEEGIAAGVTVGAAAHNDGVEDDDDEVKEKTSRTSTRRGVHARERVVVVEAESGKMFNSTGSHIPNADKSQPGWDRIWLLPEEALWLVERGSLDLWWPTRPLVEIFSTSTTSPGQERPNAEEEAGEPLADSKAPADSGDYELGLPLSLEAAYSLLVGFDGERGKVTLEKYQVYAHLRRNGYFVFRAPLVPPPPCHATSQLIKRQVTLWQWLFSLLSTPPEKADAYLANGPLVRPGFYRSYRQIFEQLDVIPRHKPDPQARGGPAQDPFRVHFQVWKAAFPKTRPPPPDFSIAVVDTRTAPSLPGLDEIARLLGSRPWDPPKEQWAGPGRLYPRLKHGYRSALVAVVDHGLVNFLRFGEGAFGEEPIWGRFDSNVAPRGGKVGGGGGARGGGGGQRGGAGAGGRGRGGRGRGRGRNRA